MLSFWLCRFFLINFGKFTTIYCFEHCVVLFLLPLFLRIHYVCADIVMVSLGSLIICLFFIIFSLHSSGWIIQIDISLICCDFFLPGHKCYWIPLVIFSTSYHIFQLQNFYLVLYLNFCIFDDTYYWWYFDLMFSFCSSYLISFNSLNLFKQLT